MTVAAALADTLTGGDADPTQPVAEAVLLDLERRNFKTLLRTQKTQARIEHTLATGKPLRNWYIDSMKSTSCADSHWGARYGSLTGTTEHGGGRDGTRWVRRSG